jgi:HD-GYP domain-containing protein (c-di-GMP phosphodiesterase class II)
MISLDSTDKPCKDSFPSMSMNPAPSPWRQKIASENLKIVRCQGGHTTPANFLSVPLRALMVEDRLTFPLYVKAAVPGQERVTFLPCLEEGELVASSWLEALRKTGLKQLYARHEDLEKVIAHLNNHLLLCSDDPGGRKEKLFLVREHLQLSVQRALQAPRLGKNIHLAKQSMQTFWDTLMNSENPWKFVWELLYHDATLYHHSVNVTILSMALTQFLQKAPPRCLIIGLAGLFHDLGLMQVDEELLHKKDPLSLQEWSQLQKHPTLAYQILKSNAEIPLDSLRLILEHHENADGSGYPQGLTLEKQHPLTRVLHLIEAYDGLTTFRPYRTAKSPYEALKILQEASGPKGALFERRLLKDFISFLSFS